MVDSAPGSPCPTAGPPAPGGGAPGALAREAAGAMRDEAIFAEALGKAPGPERQAFLDEACGGDAALRRRVEILLEGDAQTLGILELGPGAAAAPHGPAGERPGDLVGPYK